MEAERVHRWLQMMILEAGATPEEWRQFDAFVQRVTDRYPRLVGDEE